MSLTHNYNTTQEGTKMSYPSNSQPFAIKSNEEIVDCDLCDAKLQRGDGVVLRVCTHTFCNCCPSTVWLWSNYELLTCLRNAINLSGEFDVPCPLVAVDGDCAGHIMLSEIKGVLPTTQYVDYLEISGRIRVRSIAQAGDDKAAHGYPGTSKSSSSPPSSSSSFSSDRKAMVQATQMSEPQDSSVKNTASTARAQFSPFAHNQNRALVTESDFGLKILFNPQNCCCGFCAEFVPANKGIMLQGCLHSFCKDCLQSAIVNSTGGGIPCPESICGNFLAESEIKSLVSTSVYEDYIKKGFQLATASLPSFQCKTVGCCGVCLIDLADNNKQRAKIFLCPMCNKQNCLDCNAIHEGIPCTKWKSLRAETDKSITDEQLLERSEDVGQKQIRKTMEQVLTGLPKDDLALYYDAAERVMEQMLVLPTSEEFECGICSRMNSEVATGGIVLQQCSHAFCKECLQEVVKGAEQIPVACPHGDCDQFLTQAEFKNLASSEVFEKHVRWGWRIAEDILQRKFTCLGTNCEGFWEILDDAPAGIYVCPLCQSSNCVRCNVIHNHMTCDDYQEILRREAEKIKDDANRIVQQQNAKITEDQVQQLIRAQTFMRCPYCGFVCEKISGCAHVKCLNRGCRKAFNWYR